MGDLKSFHSGASIDPADVAGGSRPAALEGGGGPPHDGGMEERVAKLEENARHQETALQSLDQRVEILRERVHNDFRWTWTITLGGFLMLLGTLAKGFGWL